MNTKNFDFKRVTVGTMLAISATLFAMQAAEASTVEYYGRGEHITQGSEHGGCGGGSTDNCITTRYSSSFYAYQNDVSKLMDGDLANLKNLNVSINYSGLNNVTLDSAYLKIKAKDDATGRSQDSTSRSGDGYEYLDILKVRGQSVSVGALEIDSSNWYFNFNVTNFVTGSQTSPLDFLLASVNLCEGQSDLLFQNARLDFNYHTVYCPPVPVPAAAWLLGSGLIGMVGFSRRKAKAA